MKRLTDPALVPPQPRDGFLQADGTRINPRGQYWTYVPASDTWLFAGDFTSLVEQFRLHLIINELPVPADLEGAVSEAICERVPPKWKGCAEAATARQNMVTWGQAKRWLRTLIEYAKNRELVTQEEAEARAQTCLQCRFRTAEADCKTGGCGGTIAGFITQLAINRSTPFDDGLGACGICGCVLRAMIWFKNETLDKAAAGLVYPEDTRQDGNPPVPCWRRE